jgi:hypothetical protein
LLLAFFDNFFITSCCFDVLAVVDAVAVAVAVSFFQLYVCWSKESDLLFLQKNNIFYTRKIKENLSITISMSII